jgi:hypothetical protein
MERDATPEIEPNESTKEVERAEAVQTHSLDRPPTAEEAKPLSAPKHHLMSTKKKSPSTSKR